MHDNEDVRVDYELLLHRNCPVMVMANLDLEKGLCNGALGQLVKISKDYLYIDIPDPKNPDIMITRYLPRIKDKFYYRQQVYYIE